MVRWYFVPDYEALSVSEDGLAMKLVGNGVKLIGEDELVDSSGNRKSTSRSNPASKIFTAEFTKKFSHIAAAHPVYGQLRNLVDLSVAAAFIQDRQMYSQANWDLGVFAEEGTLSVEVLPPPRQVDSAINALVRGTQLITPIGGGVSIQARKALAKENQKLDDGTAVKTRNAISVTGLTENQWWWD
jgi:hypothetical protein